MDAIYVLEGYNKLEEANIKQDAFYIESKWVDFRYERTISAGGPCASSLKNLCSCGYSSQTNCTQFVRYALCGVTPGHTFPAGVAALHSNQITKFLTNLKNTL